MARHLNINMNFVSGIDCDKEVIMSYILKMYNASDYVQTFQDLLPIACIGLYVLDGTSDTEAPLFRDQEPWESVWVTKRAVGEVNLWSLVDPFPMLV